MRSAADDNNYFNGKSIEKFHQKVEQRRRSDLYACCEHFPILLYCHQLPEHNLGLSWLFPYVIKWNKGYETDISFYLYFHTNK